LSLEQLESVLGRPVELVNRPSEVGDSTLDSITGSVSSSVPGSIPHSPGLLPQHYAPRTRLVIAAAPFIRSDYPRNAAFLRFRDTTGLNSTDRVEVLSPAGDLTVSAAGFFAALRRLDAHGAEVIVAEFFPDIGLGVALNDRLTRAAAF
jgi:L-threonylcarbamoyladenylate synthase